MVPQVFMSKETIQRFMVDTAIHDTTVEHFETSQYAENRYTANTGIKTVFHLIKSDNSFIVTVYDSGGKAFVQFVQSD